MNISSDESRGGDYSYETLEVRNLPNMSKLNMYPHQLECGHVHISIIQINVAFIKIIMGSQQLESSHVM